MTVSESAVETPRLLHYYFGSKERLLVEVVRQDCDARIAALLISDPAWDNEDALEAGMRAARRMLGARE